LRNGPASQIPDPAFRRRHSGRGVAVLPASAPLCFTAGATTYRLSQNAASPDFRVKFDDTTAQPDLRIALANSVAAADFTLVDDVVGMDGNACKAAGVTRTVAIVGEGPSESSSASPATSRTRISSSSSIRRASTTATPPRCLR